MPKTIFHPALKVIANLIEGQRIAKPGRYQVVWIEDHFEIRKTYNPDKKGYLIITLQAKAVNEGLSFAKWNTIERRLRVLIETGVIK